MHAKNYTGIREYTKNYEFDIFEHTILQINFIISTASVDPNFGHARFGKSIILNFGPLSFSGIILAAEYCTSWHFTFDW